MSNNEKNESKWTVYLRDDQCTFIVEAMKYIEARADERIGSAKYAPFEQFTAASAKERAVEIRALIEEVTS